MGFVAWARTELFPNYYAFSGYGPYLDQRIRIGPRLPIVYAQNGPFPYPNTLFSRDIHLFIPFMHQLLAPESSTKLLELSPKDPENSSESCQSFWNIFSERSQKFFRKLAEASGTFSERYRKFFRKLAEASRTFSESSRKFFRKLIKASGTFSERSRKFFRKLAKASGTFSERSRKFFRKLAEASRTFSESYRKFSRSLCEALHSVHFSIF